MPNRNVESHFAYNPTNIDISRSSFDLSRSVKTTFNTGELVPLCPPIEVLPGDTFQIDTSKVVRLQTLLTPMMDNLYLDVYWFFVPNRIVWSHWKNFMGENTDSAWLPTNTYSVPQTTAPSGGWSKGTIADHMGIPINVANIKVSSLPFRGYTLICNEWFRSEVLQDPIALFTSDTDTNGSNGSGDLSIQVGGMPYKACKFFDYFTGALPSPQKGPDVLIPLFRENNINNGYIPVKAFPAEHMASTDVDGKGFIRGWTTSSGTNTKYGFGKNTSTTAGAFSVIASDGTLGNATPFTPSNLWADVNSYNATINELRLAFQVQKLYEKDARGGTRYIEVLKSHFGVTSPDSRLQRPEYLGGNRVPININQVIQQSGDANNTYLGDLGATSLTVDNHSDFTHSFTEHGFIHCIGVVRYDHTYQQGLEQLWSRKTRFDYYWPVFANIGEQPIFKKEIYAQGNSADDSVFGYQEAWASYRYLPNIVTGEMRSDATNSLDSWHLADDYSTEPYLSSSWIKESEANVNRVLAVSSSVSDQIFGDFYFKIKATRPMPVYSVPGLIDHH